MLTGFAHAAVSKVDSPKPGLPSSLSRRSQVQLRTQATNTSYVCEWSAPELVLGWGHDTAVDSWGFAATLFFLLTGEVSSLSGNSTSLHTNATQHPLFPDLSTPIDKAVMEATILRGPLHISGHEEVINNEAYNVLCRVGIHSCVLLAHADNELAVSGTQFPLTPLGRRDNGARVLHAHVSDNAFNGSS